MTDPDTTTKESDDGRLLTSRRAVIGALASAGVLGAGASAASSDTSAAIGGGPMADEIANLEVRVYKGTKAERPEAGVEGRVYEVYDPPDGPDHGAVYYDTGDAWELEDLRVQDLHSQSINTGQVTNKQGTVLVRQNADGGDESSDLVTDTYQSVQAGINNMGAGAGTGDDTRAFGYIQILPVDDVYDETVTIDQKHLSIFGYGQATQIRQNGDDHTIDITTNDTFIQDIAVDHVGSGSFDAIRTADNDETQLFRVSVDAAPRYAFNIRSRASHLVGCEMTGGQTAGMRVSGNDTQVIGQKGTDIQGDGFHLNGSNIYVSGKIWPNGETFGCDGHGLVVTQNTFSNRAELQIEKPTGDGARIDGTNGQYNLYITDATGPSVRVQSNADNNHIKVWTPGEIQINSGAVGTVIDGVFESGLTDDGTRSIINGHATNNGDPSSTGDWNGDTNSNTAYKWGAIVHDTSNEGDVYAPLPPSATNNWVRISGTAV